MTVCDGLYCQIQGKMILFKRETLLVTSQRIRLSTLAQTSLTVHVTSMHLQVDDDPTIIDVALRSDLCAIFLPVKTDQKREI